MNKSNTKNMLLFITMFIMLFLSACTNPTASITISFDSNGGSAVGTISYDKETSFKMPSDPKKEGFSFSGWYFDNETFSELFMTETLKNKKMDTDFTVYAKWTANKIDIPVEQYRVTYDSNGGAEVIALDVVKGETVVTPAIDKVGYTFDGWYTSDDSGVTMNQKWSNTDIVNSNITLYAKWLVNQYTISFDANQGTSISDITADYEAKISEPVAPERIGYLFSGWYTEEALSNRYIFNTMPLESITLFAKWDLVMLEDHQMRETFESLQGIKDSGGNFSEYMDADYIGDSYIFWELTNVRIDLGMKALGNAITIGGYGNDITDAGMGRIYSSLIHDGIKRIQFEGRLPFSPNSTYPQVAGKDKASNVKIKVFINDLLIQILQFKDDKEANKGATFVIENLNIIGDFSLSIEVSSGHRLTLDNILWETNKSGVEVKEPIVIDFENNRFDFDNDEAIYDFGGTLFALKEVHTNVMHPAKELDYMNPSVNGKIVARFRGDKDDYFSTPVAYMYNTVAFDYVAKLSFDARLFGSETYFGFDSEINIYYMDDKTSIWTKLDTTFTLSPTFASYEVDINKTNVQIKIEVLKGKVNIDNIVFA